MSKTVAIIGAGLGGMATAIRLKSLGYSVTVFEKNNYVGGKVSQIEIDGFRFDTGPSLLTMVDIFHDLFNSTGRKLEDYIRIQKLENTSRNFFEDGTIFDLFADREKLLEEFKTKSSDDVKQLEKYLKFIEFADKTLSPIFLHKSPREIRDIFNIRSLISLIKSLSINPFISLDSSLRKFFRDEHFIQLINRFATYNGSNPFLASSVLNIISHVEINQGAYYPSNGIFEISKGIKKLADEVGVNFVLNSNVERIIIKNKIAQAVQVDKEIKSFDIIVSNLDVGMTYKYLIEDAKKANKYSRKDLSSSVAVFLWGINKKFPELDIHNIFFAKDYKQEFKELYNLKTIPNDPTVYVNITSKYNSSDAPADSENWFILINTPNTRDFEFNESKMQNLEQNIIKKVERILKTKISQNIITRKYYSPLDLERNTGGMFGSLYGLSSNNLMNMAFRPPNKSNYKNLYFVGGTTHPGGGMPLVLASAKITTNLIKRYNPLPR